jgi:sodium transport system permease protein
LVNSRDVWILYRQELRSALRERNIVIYSVLLPLLLYPLLLWAIFSAITFVKGETEGFVARVALEGLPPEHDALRAALAGDEKFDLVATHADHESLVADLRAGRLDVLATFRADARPGVQPPNFSVDLAFDSSKDRSAAARNRLVDAVDRYRAGWVEREGARVGATPAEMQQFSVVSINVASAQNVGAFILKMLLPTLLVAMIALGCFYPAIDATAGERERSTWETTMTLAADRTSVVAAKYLYVATLGVLAGLLNVTAMVVTMGPILSTLGGGASSVSFRILPSALPVVALGAVLIALFVAAGMMICAAFARTYREGQTMISPFYLLVILPVSFLQTPDLEFTPQLALVPVVNVAMMFRDAIGGVYQWPLVATTIAVEAVTIVACLALARRILLFEEVLMGSYNGSVLKFLRERGLGRAKGRSA